MLTKLARLFLAGWRGKQERAIDCMSQAKSRWNIPTQIGDNYLLVDDSAVRSRVGSKRREGDVNNAIREPKRWSAFVIDEGRMGQIADRDRSNFFGARFGVICHDGSYRLWEWSERQTAFVPLVLSSHK